MRPHEKANILKAGIFATSLLALGVAFTLTLSKDKSIFDKIIEISTRVENVENLKQGAAVKLRGIKIGSVSELTFEDINIINIKMKINESYTMWIKEDSYISIKTQGMLGDKFVEILGGSKEKPSISAGAILSIEKGKDLKDFIDKGENILVTTNRVLHKLDMVLDVFVQDNRMDKMVDNLNQTTANLNKMLSTENQKSIQSLGKNLANITKRIEQGPGTLHSLIYDNSVHEDLQTLLGGAQRNKLIKYFIRESIKKSETIQDK